MKKLKLLLIEDNRLLREGIKIMLTKQKDMQCMETVGNGENISNLLQKHKPDIVLLDMGLRDRNSLNLVKMIKKRFQVTKVIVMDLIPAQEDVFEFVQEGVSGFILKDATVSEFLKTIRAVSRGLNILPSNLTGSLFSQIVEHAINGSNHSAIMDSVRMTKRERQVIELISDGCTNKEIAQELHLSTYTVKSHVHNILEKLALSTRVQIAKYVHDSSKKDSAVQGISLIED
ncbi:MAG TPA: response regulator transcription factor [Ignavibacteriaceae bacterium]|nr:response regulator transcription factor [Ignavibacteriaceae bacterium]